MPMPSSNAITNTNANVGGSMKPNGNININPIPTHSNMNANANGSHATNPNISAFLHQPYPTDTPALLHRWFGAIYFKTPNTFGSWQAGDGRPWCTS